MLTFHRELRGGKAPAERHPFYWAGFVAMGDGYSSAALMPH